MHNVWRPAPGLVQHRSTIFTLNNQNSNSPLCTRVMNAFDDFKLQVEHEKGFAVGQMVLFCGREKFGILPCPGNNAVVFYAGNVCEETLCLIRADFWERFFSIPLLLDARYKRPHHDFTLKLAGELARIHSKPTAGVDSRDIPVLHCAQAGALEARIPHPPSFLHNCTRSQPLRDLLDIPSQSLKHLETASLDFIHWEHQQVQDMWDKIHTSQNLREIHWDSPGVTHPPLATFHLLTDLFVWTITLEELATLSSQTRLVKLEVMRIKMSPVTGLIKLPALESLLIGSLWEDSALILDTIFTPSLCDFKLCQAVSLIDVYALHRFVLRTACPLLRLHIHILHSPEVDTLRYVQLAACLLPRLKYLVFQLSEVTAATVHEFMPQENGGRLFLPQLKELGLLGCRLDDGLVGRMVAARADAGWPLDAFRVWFDDKECDHSLDKAILNKLKHTGILKRFT
ncbi:hypothetical protein BDN72DRAFT_881527 [Pluteus cervinus]|uniref:Uncharacterized protein n=1 Tax=Pluteus cervinus TaxID=181527 RepID=A0ACD3AEU7_9AGAR|nr:hypothetical protein BDN72DRAFT_881527 [Pluteus cervinus]